MDENIKCGQCNSTFNKMFLLGKQGNADTCPVCGGKMDDTTEEDEHKDWITWYYYGFKSDNGKSTCLDDKPIDLEQHGDTFFLIKEFKAPPRDNIGNSEKAKEVLRTYIPNAFVFPENKNPEVRCPYCMSKEYTLLNKGYSLFTGFLGSGRIKRVCNYCKREF
jgi:Zn finger protein HypA/HybF involved in hydrogenase expression